MTTAFCSKRNVGMRMESKIYQRAGCCQADSTEPMVAVVVHLLQLMYTENMHSTDSQHWSK